jgi:hypothetical protein
MSLVTVADRGGINPQHLKFRGFDGRDEYRELGVARVLIEEQRLFACRGRIGRRSLQTSCGTLTNDRPVAQAAGIRDADAALA